MTGPWRMLVLDPAGDDPHWLIVTVTDSADVRPAVMESGGRRYADWPQTTQWVRDRVGQAIRVVPIAATVWRIDGEGAGNSPAEEEAPPNGLVLQQ